MTVEILLYGVVISIIVAGWCLMLAYQAKLAEKKLKKIPIKVICK